jgi:hypothetical protein
MGSRDTHTSVSSIGFSNSAGAFAGEPEGERLQKDDDDRGVRPCARCRPAFSRSGSVHDKMVAKRPSISKRLASSRGVVRNERSTLVTRRLSTLVSVELRRSRRRASIRCSLLTTALKESVNGRAGGWTRGTRTFVAQLANQRTLFFPFLLEILYS